MNIEEAKRIIQDKIQADEAAREKTKFEIEILFFVVIGAYII